MDLREILHNEVEKLCDKLESENIKNPEVNVFEPSDYEKYMKRNDKV